MISSIARRKSAIVAEYLQDRESYATVSMRQLFACGRGHDNSVILDTATTNLFFHQRSRFITYKELDNPSEVRTGDSNCFVQGFRSVRLAIKTNKGARSIRIDDIQHIPGFHINIISYKAFKKEGAHLDIRNNRIRKIKDNSCAAICENSPCESFLDLELGNSKSHNFTPQAARSTEKKSNTANLETWHKRLGHAFNENIVHLTKHADGVIIKDSEKRTTRDESSLCEVCNTAVSHTHIPRQPQYAGDLSRF
ncbi:hypothetical protein GcM1_162012 [Golovinomyces cichoracearum]|uniref:Retrovirus-related Pol polyprotein from transposon TNT 1-94-like beta-barrel domain-containing protein n=1 Tax=Golovinomyces cichoracearum TaxID=62708 RepID=A0A420J8S5_9PEZI|nr:hypothetical protein GcM1_162012 [Golovinomyces cichoracearum]